MELDSSSVENPPARGVALLLENRQLHYDEFEPHPF
jgi:hypothetical protein